MPQQQQQQQHQSAEQPMEDSLQNGRAMLQRMAEEAGVTLPHSIGVTSTIAYTHPAPGPVPYGLLHNPDIQSQPEAFIAQHDAGGYGQQPDLINR